MNKRWLDESLTRQKNLLSEINLKRMNGSRSLRKNSKNGKINISKISRFDY
ncbi:toxin-antitoxin system, toxin component, PIN family [Leptospira santarosai str. 200702252]|nr:putative toxin-antitoxin system, toxin component, PIN family [Leptospira santarosai str. 200403458]EMO96979.1 toxin-antitoxin system, toxin component, PIN family [Leptospira santarosai str. 200702252]